jgi:uncharacterized protein YukE
MKTVTYYELGTRLNHITHEISEIKKIVVKTKSLDKQKTENAWDDLISASDEVSRLWKGKSTVEEISDQREKI